MNELILLEDLGTMFPRANSKEKHRFGLYKCFCGKEFKTQVRSVKSGATKSCGCIGRNKTHGLTNHRLYNTWSSMINRCNSVASKNYIKYGARGIKVCDRWLKIENFISDMYPSFKEGLTLDRIDVNGNYEPSNCRWATIITQNRNTRRIYSHNTSGYRGVSFSKEKNKYKASIKINSKQVHIGYFDLPIEAAKSYDKYVYDNNLEHSTNNLLH